jgi:3-oxoadipate enol-lactonase
MSAPTREPAPDATDATRFVRVRGIDVCHELHGPESGPPLLLISGTGADLRSDPRRVRHPLATAGFRTAMYDQRGLGRTSKPDGPYSMEDYADDAAGLMDTLGWDRAHIVGISFGGMVAQHLAIRHPGRIARLVLACTSSGGAGGSSFDLLAIEDLPEDERLRIGLSVLDRRNDPTTTPPTLAPGLGPYLRATAAMRTVDADDPVRAAEKALGARRQLEARARHDAWERLAEITASTLVIGGRYDLQAPPENLRRLAERIPGAELLFCDGGHAFMVQDPSAWPAIIAFLLDAR